MPNAKGRASILLIGRYRSDQPTQLVEWRRRYGDCLDIDYKTVHRSKGLEADYVMILNMVEGARGFPSQIKDDPVLQIPMPSPDPFPMAEERRLFYVALTRARRQVRIYTIISKPSRFLIELANNKALKIEPVDAEPLETCPKCKNGVLTVRSSKYGKFKSCSTFPRCDYKNNLPKEQQADDAAAETSTDNRLTRLEPETGDSPPKATAVEERGANSPIASDAQKNSQVDETTTLSPPTPQPLFRQPFFKSSSLDVEGEYQSGIQAIQACDFHTAVRHLSTAADHHHVSALHNLTLILGSGRMSPYDFDRASDCWYKAANAGHPTAAASLPLLELADRGGFGTDNLAIFAEQQPSDGNLSSHVMICAARLYRVLCREYEATEM